MWLSFFLFPANFIFCSSITTHPHHSLCSTMTPTTTTTPHGMTAMTTTPHMVRQPWLRHHMAQRHPPWPRNNRNCDTTQCDDPTSHDHNSTWHNGYDHNTTCGVTAMTMTLHSATTMTVTPHSATTPTATTTPHGVTAVTAIPHVVWRPQYNITQCNNCDCNTAWHDDHNCNTT